MTNCQCLNCQTRERWHIHNMAILKDNDTPSMREYIKRLEDIDAEYLTCFNKKSNDKGFYMHNGMVIITDIEKFKKTPEGEEWKQNGGKFI